MDVGVCCRGNLATALDGNGFLSGICHEIRDAQRCYALRSRSFCVHGHHMNDYKET